MTPSQAILRISTGFIMPTFVLIETVSSVAVAGTGLISGVVSILFTPNYEGAYSFVRPELNYGL
jgi:hypothetical protein